MKTDKLLDLILFILHNIAYAVVMLGIGYTIEPYSKVEGCLELFALVCAIWAGIIYGVHGTILLNKYWW